MSQEPIPVMHLLRIAEQVVGQWQQTHLGYERDGSGTPVIQFEDLPPLIEMAFREEMERFERELKVHRNTRLGEHAERIYALELELAEAKALAKSLSRIANERAVVLTRTCAARDQAVTHLNSLLDGQPLPDGTYLHDMWCNGDRKQRPGTMGISCSCRLVSVDLLAGERGRRKEAEARVEKLEGELNNVLKQLGEP